jgi:NAD-dependent dihydropyrimidine dehydrogenase PreA subunit
LVPDGEVSQTFRTVDERRSDPVVYIIAEPCIDVKDKACIEECPVDCIYEGERMLYIQPEECIDCAACEPACPVEAIFYEDDVPDEWKQFTPINKEFFEDSVSGLGTPGGASTVDVFAGDHPKVASWE